MKEKFDLIAIGTGSAASAAAYKCRSAGWKVAIIDSRPFGGTCALRGCDPKKVLIGAAELIDWHHRMAELGIIEKDVRIDWQALMRFKRTFTDPVPKSMEQRFTKAGITTFHGRASFVDQTTVRVGNDTLIGRYVLIATGAEPMKLGIKGEEYLTTSEQFLELDKLPERIIFVGGGYISFEFAHLAARAGSKVRILHRGSNPLEGFDPDLVTQLVQVTKDVGIDIELDGAVNTIEKSTHNFIVHTDTKREKLTFEADMVVHGAGRVPEVSDLNLEKAGVDFDRKGVKVNEYLQSVSNPVVYAAGDDADSGGLPLTPVAGLEGKVVALNLLEGNHHKPDYTGVATVAFTVPSIASVGLSETEAKKQGLKFRTNHQDTSSWYSTRRVNMKHTGFKVLVEEKSNLILGAHLLGPHADEVINLFAMAIKHGIKADEVKEILFAYPTSASDIGYMVL